VSILSQVAKRIKAYHGSPHDFDKFSTENIGTGEGAQAYGHGLYFAEREGTAASYRDALSGKNASFDDGSYVPEWVLQAQKDGKLDTAKKDFQDRIVQIKDAMDSSPQPHLLQDQLDSNAKILQGIDRLNSGDVPKVGRMYEVDIDASPDELLDFDAPISEQSDYIKNALENLNMKTFSGDKRGIDFMSKNNWRGQTLYETLVGANVRGQPQATATLQEVGIKGIKYADAQTRFSPKGRTNNYVIFDDKTVEIARKYGVSMPVAGAILAGTMTPEDAQAASIPKVTRDLMNKYFTPEAIEYATKQADARKSREAITEIDIDDFLNLAREGYSPQKAEGIASVNQFDDLPFLSIREEDGIANVIGHEGRHRARRLKEMGESKMPIRVRSDIRWDQQNDPKAFDYLHDYPRILFNEDRTKKTPFPFRQGESNFIPSEFMDIQDISRAKNQRKSAFTSSDDKLLKELGLGSSAALASGNTLASVKPQDGLLKDTGDVLGEIMAGANRGVVDALNFFTVDQINAISQLMGSDKRVPTLYDVPLIEEATSGNFMDKGALRQAVRQGSEFLSPI